MADSRKSLPDLLEERESLKAKQQALKEALDKVVDNQKRLLEMKAKLETEAAEVSVRLIALHKEVVVVCNEEIKTAGQDGVVVHPDPVKLPADVQGLIPDKAEFDRLVNSGTTKMRDDVKQAVKDSFTDKSLNEVIDIAHWPEREGQMRGAGWKSAQTVAEMSKDERVCVAQMSKSGQKVSIVEGRLATIEMDGSISVDVGGNLVEVDTKGAASKVYRLKQNR